MSHAVSEKGGSLNFDQADDIIATPNLDWVIAGGESGPGARPSHPDWFRGLRDQCADAGVTFFFKQWGEWIGANAFETSMPAASKMIQDFHGETVLHVGKKHTGRTLDGVIHDGCPSKAPE